MLRINNSGKSNGNYHTKCHNGTLLPFRARCNKVCLAKHHTLIIKHCNIRTLNAQWRRTSSGVTGTRSPRSLQSTAMRSSKSRTTLTIFHNILIDTLLRVMRTTDTVILEFFAPWCPACVTFKPEFEKLQEKHWDIPMYTV